MDKDEREYYVLFCKCNLRISAPFNSKEEYFNNKEKIICINRYKLENITIDPIEHYIEDKKIYIQKIVCDDCGESIGFYIARGDYEHINDLNYAFFSRDNVKIKDNNEIKFTIEELQAYKDDEEFYSSDELTDNFFDYFKKVVTTYIDLVKKFRQEKEKYYNRYNLLLHKIHKINELIKNSIKKSKNLNEVEYQKMIKEKEEAEYNKKMEQIGIQLPNSSEDEDEKIDKSEEKYKNNQNNINERDEDGDFILDENNHNPNNINSNSGAKEVDSEELEYSSEEGESIKIDTELKNNKRKRK